MTTLRLPPKQAREYGALNPDQFSLIEVSQDDRQQLDERLKKLLSNETTKKAGKFEEAIKRIRTVVSSAHEQGFHWENDGNLYELLSKPLCYWRPSDLDVQPAEDDSTSDETEVIPWSEEAIKTLHEKTLMYSLGVLNSKGNAKEKREILEWIWSPDGHWNITRQLNGREIVGICRTDEYPFAFQTCCRLVGYDYEALRAGLAWSMRDVLPSLGFKPRN